MSSEVRFERDGDVLVLHICNPPVNAGSLEVRQGLLQAMDTLSRDANLKAAVIIGSGSTFVAGSDLREFGQPLQDPQLPAVIEAIERCSKPVVAAIHGAALGGGFELALGCDARVSTADARVGLPEVTLGMIPGAGGTQRLPRLVGIARAIQLICSGERIRADEAHRLGVIDATTTAGDLRAFAVAHARSLDGRKRRLSKMPVPQIDAERIPAVISAALKQGKSRPQVVAAIEAVQSAAELVVDEALCRERRVFQELRMSADAFALRYLFFAERDAGKRPELAGVEPRPLRRLAIVGAGTMGCGIAISALDAGLQVTLLERDEPALERGVQRLREHYNARVAAGKMAASTADASQARLTPSVDWAVVAQADAVIEAVFEDLDAKVSVFRRLDEVARPETILASNTSYLDLDAIASATSRPQDVVGLHFFSPANVMRLLEVVRGEHTAPTVLATGLELAKRLSKLPVVTGNAFGFIGNRIYAAYRRQCEFLLEEGAWPEQVDHALQAYGFAMGPFAVADMSGLDIAWRMRQAQAASRDSNARYVDIPDRLCERGRLGRKTGAGYYRYEVGGKGSGVSDPAVHELIAEASRDKGLARRTIGDQEIQRRALLSMVNEAAALLAEGVALRPSDVDVVLVNGYGFPRWQGGPVYAAKLRSRQDLEHDMDWLAEVSGPGFVRADLSPLL